ncbi:MAG: hypothetical protein QOE39_473 [Bradyrhizobium sp.]|nr:hypothetical protein [Bradyrhizobium sp.]
MVLRRGGETNMWWFTRPPTSEGCMSALIRQRPSSIDRRDKRLGNGHARARRHRIKRAVGPVRPRSFRVLVQSPLRLLGITGDRECCAPACSREASCPSLNACRPSFHSLQLSAPACPRCKAPMMLVGIELSRPGVDLHTFQCAICNHVLKTLAVYEDPMKSKGVGRWLQGDLHPPK